MKQDYVKVWVWDEDLQRVQTRWVLYGTQVKRYYGRMATDVLVHDLTWEREYPRAIAANSHRDVFYFTGNPHHLTDDFQFDPKYFYNEVDWGVEVHNTPAAALYMIKGLKV